MQTIHDLPTPALLIDLDRLEVNVARMAERAEGLGVRLRPHMKTHKCVEVGRMQLAAGAAGITVATLYEAEIFAMAGFDDITWAFPVILSRIPQALELSRRVELGVVVDSDEAVSALGATGHSFRTWIKLDCGYHRAGVDPGSSAAEELARGIQAAGLRFTGLLSHSGDAYETTGEAAHAEAAAAESACGGAVAERLRAAGVECPDVSVGSTPSMTAARSLAGATEARPGNYAYFDRSQVALGSCGVTDCAATVLASVVSNAAGHGVVDAGALAMSKDAGPGDLATMGEVFADYESGVLHDHLRIRSLSQEHGVLTEVRPVGERLRILPNHSCLTVACFSDCYAVRGERVIERWRVWNGR